jgi:hypothetical protein
LAQELHYLEPNDELRDGESIRDEGNSMFRIELDLLVKIEGHLVGEYAEHTRTLAAQCDSEKRLMVDIRDVTYVDSTGEDALLYLGRLGAQFIADNVYTRFLCERLKLPVSRTGSRSGDNGSGSKRKKS